MATTERTKSPERGGATYQIRALDRGLDILEAFSLAQPELTIGQIGMRTNLPKPTIVRLLSVLSERGYVERVSQSDRYRLGVRTLEVGSVFLQSTSLQAEARPIMRRLADQTGQTANLGILDNHQVVHIEVVAPDRPVRFWASIGKREDAYFSGLGKMLISALAEHELASWLQEPRSALTPYTFIGADELNEELDLIRAQGFAIDAEESNLGVMCIAAPIIDGSGRMVAAVSISGLRTEFDENGNMDRFTAHVKDAAEQISTRLGSTADAT